MIQIYDGETFLVVKELLEMKGKFQVLIRTLTNRLLVGYGQTQWVVRRCWDLQWFGGRLLLFSLLLLLNSGCPSCL